MEQSPLDNPAILTKVCKKCQQDKSLGEYRKNPSTKDGLQTECKACNDSRASTYYQENKKKIIKKILSARKAKEKLRNDIKKLEEQVKTPENTEVKQ